MSYRRRYYRRRRRSNVGRAFKKAWYSPPARFGRKVVGGLITGTAMAGLRMAYNATRLISKWD